VSKLKLRDFSSFYENLFFHNDRPSCSEQREIEKLVYDYSYKIRDVKFGNHFFSSTEITAIISKLSLNVSCGYDGLLDEFLRYGISDNLVILLTWLFNSVVVTGHIPDMR
jgi:hypothetical protein